MTGGGGGGGGRKDRGGTSERFASLWGTKNCFGLQPLDHSESSELAGSFTRQSDATPKSGQAPCLEGDPERNDSVLVQYAHGDCCTLYGPNTPRGRRTERVEAPQALHALARPEPQAGEVFRAPRSAPRPESRAGSQGEGPVARCPRLAAASAAS